jgi:hypothetical protein
MIDLTFWRLDDALNSEVRQGDARVGIPSGDLGYQKWAWKPRPTHKDQRTHHPQPVFAGKARDMPTSPADDAAWEQVWRPSPPTNLWQNPSGFICGSAFSRPTAASAGWLRSAARRTAVALPCPARGLSKKRVKTPCPSENLVLQMTAWLPTPPTAMPPRPATSASR